MSSSDGEEEEDDEEAVEQVAPKLSKRKPAKSASPPTKRAAVDTGKKRNTKKAKKGKGADDEELGEMGDKISDGPDDGEEDDIEEDGDDDDGGDEPIVSVPALTLNKTISYMMFRAYPMCFYEIFFHHFVCKKLEAKWLTIPLLVSVPPSFKLVIKPVVSVVILGNDSFIMNRPLVKLHIMPLEDLDLLESAIFRVHLEKIQNFMIRECPTYDEFAEIYNDTNMCTLKTDLKTITKCIKIDIDENQ